jgi:hypothetical protein
MSGRVLNGTIQKTFWGKWGAMLRRRGLFSCWLKTFGFLPSRSSSSHLNCDASVHFAESLSQIPISAQKDSFNSLEEAVCLLFIHTS